jgi:RND family efflux transporter MFP subunit
MTSLLCNLGRVVVSRRSCSLIICGTILWAGLASGCNSPTASPPVAKPPVVTVSPAVKQATVDYDEFVGRTEATETVEVRARISGVLQKVHFLDGSMVEQGQLLFTIEKDQYAAVHAQSISRISLYKANLGLAESSFERSKKLFPQGAISKEEYDEAEAAVIAANAQMTAAEKDAELSQLDLNYTEILSPITGRIDRALITPGNMLTGGLGSGTLLTRIVKDKPIYAYVDIDERSVLRFLRKARAKPPATNSETTALRDLGIQCELQLQDETDYPHVGILDFAENEVDSATGTIRIRGVFDNERGMLRGGLFVRVRIPVSEPYQAVLIPEQAIGSEQGEKFAFVVSAEGKSEKRSLELGGMVGNMRVVKQGLSAGEDVVVKGIQRVRPGLQVTVERQTSEAAASNL